MVWARWRRTTVGTSCKFCLMLASRGAVYTSEDVAKYGYAGSRYHDHCDCGAELVADPADADAVRIDPVDADRILRLRVKGRDYVYDLSNYRNLGVTDPPKAARAARVSQAADEPTFSFDPPDIPRTGDTNPVPGAEQWLESLTKDEITALTRYTGKSGELSADSINELLASGEELTTAQAESVRHIDAAIAKATGRVSPRAPLYRGVERALPPGQPTFLLSDSEVFDLVADQIEADYPVGSIVKLTHSYRGFGRDRPGGGGFASTSTDVTPALDASVSRESPGLIFEIAPTPGAPVQAVTKYDDEFEVLLGRGERFRVVAVHRRIEFWDSGGDSRYRTVVQVQVVQ